MGLIRFSMERRDFMRRTKGRRMLAYLLCALFCVSPAFSRADDAGVLTETELNDFLISVLQQSMDEEPQNAPVGEESLTEDGYAFLYRFATLYYDKPVLDSSAALNGFAVTEETLVTPRGIQLGSPAEALVAAYGWQNHELMGDGSFAALYQLDQLPQSAYWAWAQLSEGGFSSVQCAIHAGMGNGRYTDAGIRYQVEGGVVTGIHVYGLNQSISEAEVASNLQAVTAVQAAGSGDEPEWEEEIVTAQGYFEKSDAQAFGAEDLRFAGMDFLQLNEEGATQLFGSPQSEEWVQDETGAWYHTTQREGIQCTHVLDSNKQNSRLGSILLTGEGAQGPRGVKIGDGLQSVLSRFRSDGSGAVMGNQALLYGDGVNPPSGVMEDSGDGVNLSYLAEVTATDGTVCRIALHMSFGEGLLREITLYSL